MQRSHLHTRYVRDFWSSLSLPAKVSLALFFVVLVLWVRSYWVFDGVTTDNGLNTFMMDRGQVVWMHRSAEGADYIAATGPDSGFMALGVGAFKTPTAGR